MGKPVFRKQGGGAGKGASAPVAFPDVCKTPGPNAHAPGPGPVPIPYPQIGLVDQSRKKVKVVKEALTPRGAPPSSSFSQSKGDEAGAAEAHKGPITSLNHGKAGRYHVPYSMDVKIEGKSAVRMSDIPMLNHGAVLQQLDQTLVEYDSTLRRAPSFTPKQAVRVQRVFEERTSELLGELEASVGADEAKLAQVKQLRGLVEQAASGRRRP